MASNRNLPFVAIMLASALCAWPVIAATDAADLADAVRSHDDARVTDLLKQKRVPVNSKDATGGTALTWAAMRGDAQLVTRLLKAGADPDLAAGNGMTALQIALESRSSEVVGLLLAKKASPNAARDTGETPLMTAARLGDVEATKLLLARGAAINVTETQFGQTALMWAIGHPDEVGALLAGGADPNVATKSWDVTATRYLPPISTLGSTGIPWVNDGEFMSKAGGLTALHLAAQEGDLGSAKLLLDAGAGVNTPAADGATPLLLALYKWKATATMRGPGGGIFGNATYAPDIEMANFLLDRGADVNVKQGAGYTPLHAALLALHEPPAPTFGPSRMGVTPKRIDDPAALELVKRLLSLKADPNAATVRQTAGPIGNVRLNPSPIGSTPLLVAADSGNLELVEMLIAAGAKLNAVRSDGHTPLSLASQRNDPAVVKALLDHGADMTLALNPDDKLADPVESVALERRDQTVLHVAAAAGSADVVKLLIERGASLTARNDKGETPLDIADAQERYRFAKAMEGAKARSLDKQPVRSTATSDILKTAATAKRILLQAMSGPPQQIIGKAHPR